LIRLDNLPSNRHLYEINSYDWLDKYPDHCEPIEYRLKLLFEELWHTDNDSDHVDTSRWTFKDIPSSNGYKTIMSIWFILQEKFIQDPITVHKWKGNSKPHVLMEPGAIRTQLLPYLPNQKIRFITFNIDNYLESKYEFAFNQVMQDDLVDKPIPIQTRSEQLVGIYKIDDRKIYAAKCRQQKIQISYNKKGLVVNNKPLIKFKDGKYYLTSPKLYKVVK